MYDLTELQKDAYKFFGFSAKETLSTLQTLYERYKVVTYPRTDSRYLTTDIIDTLADRIQACKVAEYREIANQAQKYPKNLNKSYVDNQKVSDHHAIIPTEQTPHLTAFSPKERKLYDLIVKRFLGIFYPPFTFEQTTVEAKIAKETFRAKGKRVLSQGWKEVFQNQEDEDKDDQKLPLIKEGETLSVKSLKSTRGETTPPKHFNEGTLLAAMENPVRFMSKDNKELVDTIGKTGGLGTVATRADIIDKLFNSFSIEKTDNGIRLTSKGKQLLELVPTTLKSPELTAEWEQKLELIEKGKLNATQFINEMKDFTRTIVGDIKGSDQTFKHDNITGTRCPECGNLMLEVQNKKGKMLVCKDRECNHRKNVSKVTNARCPKCRKKLVLRGQGEGQMFTCQCGHREKLSTFNERRKQDKNKKVSKREVSKYMKKQDQNEPINTALADQLAQLKNKLK